MIVRKIAWRSPLAAFAPLAGEPFAALLHPGARARARWSTIVAFPSARVEIFRAASSPSDPFRALSELLADRRRAAEKPFGAPFATGLVGYVGYEVGARLEPSVQGPASPFALPDLQFGAYDAAALFDRLERRAFICATEERAGACLEAALGSASLRVQSPRLDLVVTSNFTREAYLAAVAEAVARIRDGDFFQVNLSQQLRVDAGEAIAAFDLFQRLAEGDAPHGAYIRAGGGAILSNSPEGFFRVDERGRIVCEPIKGTRPRGRNPQEDEALARALLEDAKERAENIMIADLLRNDLSRICRDGSIREDAIAEIETHETVHHLVSRISGKLRDGHGAVDAMRALFPCGSVTGAPKIEAMKTISALEGRGRGPYCGAIGFVDDGGSAGFSVAIRILIAESAPIVRQLTIPVGGGVTLRSDPLAEYEETLVKARGALAALGASMAGAS